jgi:hypothetical protein
MAPPKYGDLGKKSDSLLNDDFKFDNKCEIKTKIASSGLVCPAPSLFPPLHALAAPVHDGRGAARLSLA